MTASRLRTRAIAGVIVIATGFTAAGCSSDHPPTLNVVHAADGRHARFAGVALSVPAGWRIRHRPPSFCGSVTGYSAYFSVGSNSPATMGCSSSAPTGPYLSVKCHPYPDSEPAPTGRETRLGPFPAIVESDSPTSPTQVASASIYLIGRDTQIDIYALGARVEQVETSIHQVPGSC